MMNSNQTEEDAVQLISGETYIIFNNLRGKVIIWINCDKEMQISMTTGELIKAAPSIFPQLDISNLLYFLSRGDYVFTDKLTIRPLKPQNPEETPIIPTLAEVNLSLKKAYSSHLNF